MTYILESKNFDNSLEYISTWIKGKVKNPTPLDHRFLFKDVKTNEKIILYFEHRNFAGDQTWKSKIWIERIGQNLFSVEGNLIIKDVWKYVTPTHIKNNVRNYYYLNDSPAMVETCLDLWKASDPLVHTGGYYSSELSHIKNYTFTYKFNNKTW